MKFSLASRPHLVSEFKRLSDEYPDVYSVLLFHQDHGVEEVERGAESQRPTAQALGVELIPNAPAPRQVADRQPRGGVGCEVVEQCARKIAPKVFVSSAAWGQLQNGKLFSWFLFLAAKLISARADRLKKAIQEFEQLAKVAGQAEDLNEHDYPDEFQISKKRPSLPFSSVRRTETKRGGVAIEWHRDFKSVHRWIEHVHATIVGDPDRVSVQSRDGDREFWCSCTPTSVFRASELALTGTDFDAKTLVVDETQFVVCWGNREPCKLGKTQQFRFFQYLAATPRVYLPFLDIADYLGYGHFGVKKLQAVKCRLVKQLHAAGYGDIADAIHRENGYYGLFFKGEIKMVGTTICTESCAIVGCRFSCVGASKSL